MCGAGGKGAGGGMRDTALWTGDVGLNQNGLNQNGLNQMA